MLNGFYVFNTGTATDAVYTPEFPRAALEAVFSADIKLKGGASSLDIAIEARNSDEVAFTEVAVFSTITGVGLATKQTAALREIIRLRMQFPAGGTAGDFYFLQILPPQWLSE